MSFLMALVGHLNNLKWKRFEHDSRLFRGLHSRGGPLSGLTKAAVTSCTVKAL